MMDDAIAFQEQELKKYESMTYEELMAIKGRLEIESPEELSQYSFAREIKKDEFGGLEVSVFHYFYPKDETPDWLKEACGGVDISLGESRFSRWFNILKNNKITWPSFEHLDGED